LSPLDLAPRTDAPSAILLSVDPIDRAEGLRPVERAAEWIERHAALVLALVRRCCPRSAGVEPDDLAQEVRIRLWRAVLAEREIRNVPAFVRAVTMHAVADVLRGAKAPRALSIERLGEGEPGGETLPGRREPDPVDGAIERESMESALGSLVESRRRVVLLHLAGFRRDEIALRLDYSDDKVRNLLYRGLEDLRRRLHEGTGTP
jgi:RNA polymerase sigma-70 factor (ECF subfamily)